MIKKSGSVEMYQTTYDGGDNNDGDTNDDGDDGDGTQPVLRDDQSCPINRVCGNIEDN